MADEQAICTVIKEQFGAEVAHKENELRRIDDRIQLAKMMLHRLRLGILAQQYGLSGFYLMEDYSRENVGVQVSWNSFESDFLNWQQQEEEAKKDVGGLEERREVGEGELFGGKREGSTPDLESTITPLGGSSVQSSRVPSEVSEEDTADQKQLQPELSVGRRVSSLLNDLRKGSPSSNSIASSAMSTAGAGPGSGTIVEGRGAIVCEEPLPVSSSSPNLPANLPRFATKKRVIVGNTSQFLDPSARSTVDGSTHKWMVYVRGPGKEPDISSFVKAVRFFLHPSYHPNDIIRISKPPFHLTRYGWGEFPVRVQLEFTDKVNKHVDIIHNLVLDRTHTGHQTLGSETVVDLDLVTTEPLTPASRGASSAEDDRIGPRNNSAMHPFTAPQSSGKKHKSEREQEATAPEREVNSQQIHHIFLPAISTVDQVLLDHSYSQIVVTSRRLRRPLQSTTPDEEAISMCSLDNRTTNQQSNVEEVLLDDLLHSVVKTVPLCGPESSGFHLVAPSFEQFKMWNIGRRRASEWMRAVAMKRVIRTLDPPVPQANSLTTKQLMEWCRRNGYTPLDPVQQSSGGFCKYCGCQLPASWEEMEWRERNSHPRCADKMEVILEEGNRGGGGFSDSDSEEMEEEEEEREDHRQRRIQQGTTTRIGQRFSTLSDPFRLFESLASKARKLRVLQEQQARDQVVDVLSLPSRRHHVVEPLPRFRVPQTPELKWVQRTAAAIGIRIYPAVIDRMYAHVVEHMIYMACTKFARVIMDRAVTESAREVEGDSNDERCIVPLHIYRAVESQDCCDFLTNTYMGVPQADDDSATAEPPSIANRDRTFRDE